MGAYSFLNTSVKFAGPGLVAELGAGAGAAEEGVVIEPNVDKTVLTVGADGTFQHSLVADNSGKITIKLLKTSPTNKSLMIAYDIQQASSAVWGINTIVITDPTSGDYHACQGVAFLKKPTITQAKEAGFNEWTFQCGQIDSKLGSF